MDITNRFNKDILNRESMRIIANDISSRIKRTLTTIEITDLFAFTRLHATQNWVDISSPKIRTTVVRNFLESRFTNEGRAKSSTDQQPVDLHEIMKGHIGTSEQEPDYESVNNVDTDGNPANLDSASDGTDRSKRGSLGSIDNIGTINKVLQVLSVGNVATFMGKSDESSLQQLVNPQAAWRKNYIILDSRYRDTSQDTPGSGITNFIWNFLANSSVNTAGAVNSLGTVQQLVSIQCPNLRVPFQNNALVNSYKRVTLLINEFSGQSYIGQEGRKFHFIYSTELDGNMIECRALPHERGTFDFAKPITQLDTFTVSFSCPLEPMVFDMDRALMAVQYTNPAVLVSTVPHALQTGDQVYLTTFSTNDTVADAAVISNANNVGGHNIFVVDLYTIRVEGLDLTGVTAPINPYNTQVYFGSKRVFIPLELKYVSSSATSVS